MAFASIFGTLTEICTKAGRSGLVLEAAQALARDRGYQVGLLGFAHELSRCIHPSGGCSAVQQGAAFCTPSRIQHVDVCKPQAFLEDKKSGKKALAFIPLEESAAAEQLCLAVVTW